MMTRVQPRWVVGSRNPEKEAILCRELGIGSLLAACLVNRGITDPLQAETFLHPKLEDLHDPFLLPDARKAVELILEAREREWPIYLHGDYDVDGVTSAALFDRFLRRIGCKVKTHVPHRIQEGYGIHDMAIEEAKAFGAKLLLTCDCGGSALKQVQAARELDMVVVVTDHHQVGEEWPNAHAFVNPHRPDSTYPFPDISGAGVAFKVCQAITQELNWPVQKFQEKFIDLAILGTVADVMPLVGENRILVRHGLERLSNSNKLGIKHLINSAFPNSTDVKLKSRDIGFRLAPRLNAAGRIDCPSSALQLLLTESDDEAKTIAEFLETLNTTRRSIQDEMVGRAAEIIAQNGFENDLVIVVANHDWHPGIVGIVAGRLRDQFSRPAFVLGYDPDIQAYKGSGRSIPEFHLFEVIEANRDIIIEGGGHAKAAGLSVSEDNIELLRQRFNAFASTVISEADLAPTVFANFPIAPSEVDLEAVLGLQLLEPFGEGNPEPVFAMQDVPFLAVKPTKNPDHPQIIMGMSGRETQMSAFGLGSRIQERRPPENWDMAVQVSLDTFRGEERVKWVIKDFVPTTL